jgi:hypothetical protein
MAYKSYADLTDVQKQQFGDEAHLIRLLWMVANITPSYYNNKMLH